MTEPSVDPTGEAARWLAAARAGEPEALGQALEACRGYLLLVASRELGEDLQAKGGASDLVQEALLDAVKDFGRFQGDSEAELLLWLRRLLLNNLVDFTRRYRDAARRDVGREAPLAGASDSSAGPAGHLAAALATPSGEALANEQTAAVQHALQALPEDHRQVLLWRYQESLPFEEIGRRLGTTAGAARKLLVRAIRQVRRNLGEP
jgi:RNA polymerase sigma-70 factor (ECF subfamily)